MDKTILKTEQDNLPNIWFALERLEATLAVLSLDLLSTSGLNKDKISKDK